MAWHWIGYKTLFETMINRFMDVHVRHQVSLFSKPIISKYQIPLDTYMYMWKSLADAKCILIVID